MTKQGKMVDKQANGQDLLADEPEISGKIGEQGNSCHNRNIVTPTIRCNKNELAPTKYC